MSHNIVKIQSAFRGYLLRTNEIKLIQILKNHIINNNAQHNELFIKCQKIKQKYNPAKNEYKFIYGGLIQLAIINFLDELFNKCEDLDADCKYGSQYKVDCKLNLTSSINLNLSIKAKKNKVGNVIIINKLNNNKEYNLNDLITLIIILELNDIIIIPHKVIDNKYIENNGANITYKSSLFTYLYKNNSEFIINLEKNNKFNNFWENEYPNIQLHNIYNELYDKL